MLTFDDLSCPELLRLWTLTCPTYHPLYPALSLAVITTTKVDAAHLWLVKYQIKQTLGIRFTLELTWEREREGESRRRRLKEVKKYNYKQTVVFGFNPTAAGLYRLSCCYSSPYYQPIVVQCMSPYFTCWVGPCASGNDCHSLCISAPFLPTVVLCHSHPYML